MITRSHLIGLALSLTPAVLLANDTSIGVSAGQVRPLKSSSLRLLREDLRIAIGPQKVVVDVSFRLQNDGPDSNVQLGFPYFSRSELVGNAEDYNGAPDIQSFECKVDGVAASVTSQTGPNIAPTGLGAGFKLTSWKMWSVPFRAGQTRTVSHRYLGDLGGSVAGRLDPPGVSFFQYILSTGNNWKGPIEEFHLVLAPVDGVQPSDIYGVSLPGLRRSGQEFRLDLRDFRPSQELFISVDNDFSRHPLSAPRNWVNPDFRLKTGQEICRDSAFRLLTETDLKGRGAKELTLMRNEIFARRGRPFQDSELRAHFSKIQWYRPDPKYSDARLSEVERRNIHFLLEYQQRHGLTW